MSYEREHRLDDRNLQDLLDKIESNNSDFETPGKHTHAQLLTWMTGPWVARGGLSKSEGPGRRALLDQVLGIAPKLGFHDFQALALRDVLATLSNKPAMRNATLAAADPAIARRVVERQHGLNQPTDRQPPSPQGRGMWRAANRRAVTLYRRALPTGTVALEGPAVTAALASIGSGVPLDAAVCRKMEGILGVRLDRVRIHTGVVARDAASAANAEAFTVGEDIFLPSYDPTSAACQKLLLHELVHCCQWWQGRITSSTSGIGVSQPSDALEHEAEAVVARAPLDSLGVTGHERTTGRRSLANVQRHHSLVDAMPPGAYRAEVHDAPTALPRRGRPGSDVALTALAVASPPVRAVVQPATPPMPTSNAPQLVMRQAKPEQMAPKPDLPGREFFAWTDAFLKGEYRWQVAIQDLFRSSVWADKEQFEQVARDDADFLTENRDLILGSLAIFLAVGAGALFATGAAAAVCRAMLVGFGVAGIVITTHAMLKHAVRWLRLVRRANGTPEGIAAASQEWIRMMMSFAMAIEAAGALDLTKLTPSLARWMRTRILGRKHSDLDDPNVIQTARVTSPDRNDVAAAYEVPGHGPSSAPQATAIEGDVPRLAAPTTSQLPTSPLTEEQQYQLILARPFAGTAPSFDLRTGGTPGAGGDKDHGTEETTAPKLVGGSDSHKPANAARVRGNSSGTGVMQWRPFKTDNGDYLLYTTEKILKVLNFVRESGRTEKQIQQAMNDTVPAQRSARAFQHIANGVLQNATREGSTAPKCIGRITFSARTGRFEYRDFSWVDQSWCPFKTAEGNYSLYINDRILQTLNLVRDRGLTAKELVQAMSDMGLTDISLNAFLRAANSALQMAKPEGKEAAESIGKVTRSSLSGKYEYRDTKQVRVQSWRPFKTENGDHLLHISERNLRVLNLVKEGGLTRKQIQQALGVRWEPRSCATAFERVVNRALQGAQNVSTGAVENIGGVVFDKPSGKYVFRRFGALQQSKQTLAESKRLTTDVRGSVTIPAGEVWIKATPIQHQLFKELVSRRTWKRQDVERYAAEQWGNIVGTIKLQFQLEKLRIAVRFARSGPNKTDNLVNAGNIETAKDEITYTLPPPLCRVKFGQVDYWFQVSPKVHANLMRLSQTIEGVRLNSFMAKAVRLALENGRHKDNLNAPTFVVGTLERVERDNHPAYAVNLGKKTEQKIPKGNQLQRLIGKLLGTTD